jgi:predicted nucleic acid-binding protein
MSICALDAGLLAYAEGIAFVAADAPRVAAARSLLAVLARAETPPWLPQPAAIELHRLLTARARLGPEEAATRIRRLSALFPPLALSGAAFEAALDLAAERGLALHEASLLAAAAEARCDWLLSDRLPAGLAWRGVAVADPFDPAVRRKLGAEP